MVAVDLHDVTVPGDRPVGSEGTPRAQVDGTVPAQALEYRPMLVALKDPGIADIDLGQRCDAVFNLGGPDSHRTSPVVYWVEWITGWGVCDYCLFRIRS